MVNIENLIGPALEAAGEQFANVNVVLSAQINEKTFEGVMKQVVGAYTVDYSRAIITVDVEGNSTMKKVVWPPTPSLEALPPILITKNQAVDIAKEHLDQVIEEIAPQARGDKLAESKVENKIIDGENKRFYRELSFPLAVVQVTLIFEKSCVVQYLDSQTGEVVGNQIPPP